MIENNGIVDVIDHLPMVIDDHHSLAAVVDLLGFHQILSVGVADDEEGVLCNAEQRLRRIHE